MQCLPLHTKKSVAIFCHGFGEHHIEQRLDWQRVLGFNVDLAPLCRVLYVAIYSRPMDGPSEVGILDQCSNDAKPLQQHASPVDGPLCMFQ